MLNIKNTNISVKRKIVRLKRSVVWFFCSVFFIGTIASVKQMQHLYCEILMLQKKIEKLTIQTEKLHEIIKYMQKIDHDILTQNNTILKDLVKSNYFYSDFNFLLGTAAVIVVTFLMWRFLGQHNRSISDAIERSESHITDQAYTVYNSLDRSQAHIFDQITDLYLKINRLELNISKSNDLLKTTNQKINEITSSIVDMSLKSSNIDTAQAITNVIQNTTS